jgi:hypothetical protein
MSDRFKPGQRVRHIRTDETGAVVERDRCPPDATTVRYDGDDTVWNTPTCKLIPDDEEKLAIEGTAGAIGPKSRYLPPDHGRIRIVLRRRNPLPIVVNMTIMPTVYSFERGIR